jgi:hypothetical protein
MIAPFTLTGLAVRRAGEAPGRAGTTSPDYLGTHRAVPSAMIGTAHEQSVVAVYDSHAAAEAASKKLQKAGLDIKRLSIVANNRNPLRKDIR